MTYIFYEGYYDTEKKIVYCSVPYGHGYSALNTVLMLLEEHLPEEDRSHLVPFFVSLTEVDASFRWVVSTHSTTDEDKERVIQTINQIAPIWKEYYESMEGIRRDIKQKEDTIMKSYHKQLRELNLPGLLLFSYEQEGEENEI